ncbi:Fucose permease [Micromonospora phaseoli]|uniref:Fucose permease n=1 Tax=Micromonospora phaseoli TaxID=1144548 RepID=A0A1H7DSN7_9ACTN|nr:MFS transporter [Micromonospora phaseoli]PZV89424.1 fucose permease [Micromonospora phaseoli]GIJ80247.1 MFS transporter [Micromonospora phaseoli]SEK02692.1 Fucose permease [Micromonospora phaseoli]
MNDHAPALGRPFWTFWSAAALANLGDGIRVAAFPLLAAALTDDPLAVAAVAAAQFLPWLVAGLSAGALADRRSARTLLAAADTGRVVVLAALAAAVALGWATITLVVVAAFLLGVGETVRDTAAQTAVPRLVPDAQLEKANGRLVAGEIVGNEFVGPPVGALLFVLGAAIPFAVNGATLALAVMLVLSLPLTLASRPSAAAGTDTSKADRGGVLAGLRWLARQPMLRTLVLVSAAVAAADTAWFAIFVLYARDALGLGAFGFGLLLATGAAGGLIGSFAADRLVSRFRHRHVLTWSMAVTAGVPVVLAVAPHRAAAVVVVVTTSAAFAVLNVAALSVRQRLVPGGLLGRVIAASRLVTYSCTALGALAGGALAARAGIEAPFVFSGIVAVAATVAWWIASRPASPGTAIGLR